MIVNWKEDGKGSTHPVNAALDDPLFAAQK